MEILQPGTEITFRGTKLVGVIRSVTISLNNSITYNIGWWDRDSYNINLFMPEEIVAKEGGVRGRIGFGGT